MNAPALPKRRRERLIALTFVIDLQKTTQKYRGGGGTALLQILRKYQKSVQTSLRAAERGESRRSVTKKKRVQFVLGETKGNLRDGRSGESENIGRIGGKVPRGR